ncbi:lysylphosphatidylglycerol synthase domain-containing protein [Micromonospora sp. NPDC049374]|uniref:lysylphosphatidylglycerol synthase domain-containing protein n=1 Tax=Micromonospora sp. NPDC049374 TaxID=3154352 RepID=UPI003426E877
MRTGGRLDRAARVLRPAFTGVVLAALVWQLWVRRDELAVALDRISPGRLVLAALIVTVGLLPGLEGWRQLMAGLGVALSRTEAGRLYFLSSLAKYLPGGAWPIVAQAGLGLSPTLAASGFVGVALLSVLAGLVVGCAAVPQLVAEDPLWWFLPLVAAIGLAALTPPTRRAARAVAGRIRYRLSRRRTLPTAPDGPAVARTLAWLVLAWAVTGLHVAVLAGAFGPVSPAAAVGGFALAAAAGLVFFVVPGGLGARELVLGFALLPVLSVTEAVTVVTVSRFLITVGDVVAAVVAVGLHRRSQPARQLPAVQRQT